jgi:hypothetical protein
VLYVSLPDDPAHTDDELIAEAAEAFKLPRVDLYVKRVKTRVPKPKAKPMSDAYAFALHVVDMAMRDRVPFSDLQQVLHPEMLLQLEIAGDIRREPT